MTPYQYTWMVPQDPVGLFEAMGGDGKAASRLDYFLRELNGSTHTEHALLGNEPTLQTPWMFDWARRPFRTQETVRRALLSLYGTRPDGYPGNDDLGTMSAWYVFGALGLYPEVPGVGLLAMASPLFGRTSIALPNHKHPVITDRAYAYVRPKPKKAKKHSRRRSHAKSRSAHRPRRISMRCGSMATASTSPGRPIARWPTVAALPYQLGTRPDRSWGSSASATPPSFSPGQPDAGKQLHAISWSTEALYPCFTRP